MDRFMLFPLFAAAVLGAGLLVPMDTVLMLACVPALLLAVISAVHHAEVIAHKVGEPFGTLVLALAVTVIEVALVLSMMLAGGANAATVPRDTIYSAVMIICNGVVGVAAVWLDLPLTLGLAPKDMALLTMTFIVGAITLGSGRTT